MSKSRLIIKLSQYIYLKYINTILTIGTLSGIYNRKKIIVTFKYLYIVFLCIKKTCMCQDVCKKGTHSTRGEWKASIQQIQKRKENEQNFNEPEILELTNTQTWLW